MHANASGFDRIVRLILGVGLVVLAYLYMASLGTLFAVVLGIVGLVLLATAVIGWCPLYAMFGISTDKSG